MPCGTGRYGAAELGIQLSHGPLAAPIHTRIFLAVSGPFSSPSRRAGAEGEGAGAARDTTPSARAGLGEARYRGYRCRGFSLRSKKPRASAGLDCFTLHTMQSWRGRPGTAWR